MPSSLKFRAPFTVLGFLFTFWTGETCADNPSLSLKHSIELALAGNPSLAQIKARAEAMAEIPSQEGTLPDPSFSFGSLSLPTASGFNLNTDDFTMFEVQVSQTIPFPGKLALKEKAAGYEAEAAAHSVGEARLRLVRDVKNHWWQLLYLHRTLAIIADTEKLLKEVIEITDDKYRLGEVAQQDVLTAHLELAQLLQKKSQYMGMYQAELARLNTLLNRPAGDRIDLPDEIDTELPELPNRDTQSFNGLSRPLLAERKNAIDAAQTRLALAKKDYYPDFNLGVGYDFRQNTPTGQQRSDFANFRLSMNLPIFTDSKQSKAVAQRRSELLKENYALEEAQDSIDSEISTSLAAYQSSYQQFQLLATEILPLAQQTITSSLTAYQVGKTDFLTVIKAENAWFYNRIQYWQTLVEARQALAQLAAAMGNEHGE